MKSLMMFHDLPIRQKLRRIILIISGLSVLGSCAVFVTYQWISSRNVLARQLEILAEIIGDQSSAAVEFNQPAQAASILRSLKAEHQVLGAAIYGTDRKLFARYLRDDADPMSLPALAGNDGREFDGRGLLVSVPVRSGSDRVGTFIVRSDLSLASQLLTIDLLTVALVLLASTGVVLYLSGRWGRIITHPVTQLAEVVRQVSKDRNYSLRVESGRNDELGALIAGFNDMLSQVETRDAALALAKDELEVRVNVRTHELAAANKELESFSYSVSHDLRAPLRAIGGYARMLVEDFGGQIDEKGQRYLDVIQKNAGKMGQLIDDLLSFSGLGRRTVEPVRIHLETMARDVFEELVQTNPDRKLEILVGALPPIQGDRAMFRQVLINLLSNAVKYSRGRTPARIEVGSRITETELQYFVKDNGVGFPMEYVQKLFGVFQRLHTPEQFEGTGVGLALVQRIVQRHGGRVWAEGRPNEGATFSFALPKSAASPPASS
ncbi:MAG TPA: ATP-binding protein [Planctomycetota bacterium]|nr:ATP-binding protein [Planctomycetota bacterium]